MGTTSKTPQAAAQGEGTSVSLKALSPIEHDGVRYEAGETLAVPKAAADALIAARAAEAA